MAAIIAQSGVVLDDPFPINIAQQALSIGQMLHLRDHMAAWNATSSAVANGAAVPMKESGIAVLPKTTGQVILDGQDVWINWTTGKAAYTWTANQLDFFCGSAYGDTKSADTNISVKLNKWPRGLFADHNLIQDPYVSALIGTTDSEPKFRGGAIDFKITATSEAQKIDALSYKNWASNAGSIVEMRVNVITTPTASTVKWYAGLTNATQATDPTANSQYLYLVILNNTKIQFMSSDGTLSQGLTDSTLTYTVGTPFDVTFDMRNLASVAIYVNAARVLSATTFNLSTPAAAAWKGFAWLGKTATSDTAEIELHKHMTSFADQGPNSL